jgi:pSer/pThr/pTyr-binding forkhead associated (FHA) protein
MEADMDQHNSTLARSKPTLPAGAPRVLLTAVAESVTVSAETTKLVTLIGSRRDCDLSIGQSDVSKVHCALVNTGTKIIVTDLCTRAGTFVNGRPVSVATLCPGDELRVGSEPVAVWFADAMDGSVSPAAGENQLDLELPRPLLLEGAGQSYELTRLPAVIGRRSTCQVVVDTPDVSLAHALLFAVEGQSAVCDLGSRSGTYLNGQRVGLAWLADGDVLSIGGEKLSLTFGSLREVPPDAAPDADPSVACLEANDETDAELGNAACSPDLGDEGFDAEPTIPWASARGDLAALEQREAALDEREARLLAAERELARKQAELAERETADEEAVKRVAQLMGALGEAWQVFGFGAGAAARYAEPDPGSGSSSEPGADLGSPDREDSDDYSARAGLPAPLVSRALFPSVGPDGAT